MSTRQFLFSGFGGQGILFAGKFMAYKGMLDGKHVSWLPSYGPEMRGGTASCSVIISDTPVGSPIVSTPDVLVAMNLPSLDKYEGSVATDGMIFFDSSLIERDVKREDVRAIPLAATSLANEIGTPTLANMVLLGKILASLGEFDEEKIAAVLKKVISAKRADMLEANLNAMRAGAQSTGLI
ncbi:MAG: 2-oxoacid:acceptor oxidoreductase family protein [Clostridia bacterium]|nr:2-oxoacid:acceptor oxidoreductase family protein [Clostridia bacterium]MBR2926487.1 2-oxoacid:acceptor oxidoreductase family protein [Clostridia bacterium]